MLPRCRNWWIWFLQPRVCRVAWLFRYDILVWLVSRVIRDSSAIRGNGGVCVCVCVCVEGGGGGGVG